MIVDIEQEDFGMLCACAIRYCQGRETYMPDLVRSIVKPFLPLLADKELGIMIDDCGFQREFHLYGNDLIDKPGWIKWEADLRAEQEKRNKAHSDKEKKKI